MKKVLGIDPGTQSFDLFGLDLDSNTVCIDISIPTRRIMKNPEILIEAIDKRAPFDLIAAPSGFGLPLKKVEELTTQDFFEILLRKPNGQSTIGLQAVLEKMKLKHWNAVILPGVKHLPTVKQAHKINKIDLGTADKLSAVVVGIKSLMEVQQIPCTQVTFIMLELGAGFSAALAIEKGQIIDGIGGSNVMGFKACGTIDGELAYLLPHITKNTIYHGGVASIVGYEEMTPEEIISLAQKDEQSVLALETYIDQIAKAVYSLLPSFSPKSIDKPIQILLSGRLAKNQFILDAVEKKLLRLGHVQMMRSYAQFAKRAAQGAAFIAEGLLQDHQSQSKEIVENMKLKEAHGHILDHIYLKLQADLEQNKLSK